MSVNLYRLGLMGELLIHKPHSSEVEAIWWQLMALWGPQREANYLRIQAWSNLHWQIFSMDQIIWIETILRSINNCSILLAMVFPVVMYGCESWTVKKAERWRIDAFELWFWRRLLRVLWITRISKQSIQKEISPEYSLEGLMLKLKLWYFDHLMQSSYSLEKTLMLGKIEGMRRRGWQRMR